MRARGLASGEDAGRKAKPSIRKQVAPQLHYWLVGGGGGDWVADFSPSSFWVGEGGIL